MAYISEEELQKIDDIVDRAAYFAVNAHRGATRKNKLTPVSMHLFEAASVSAGICEELTDRGLIEKNDSPSIIAASLLHDTVEDTDTDIEDIKRIFGERVAALVKGETEDRGSRESSAENWKKRKEESLRALENTHDLGIKTLWLADKVSNIRSFYRLRLKKGKDMWENFHQKDNSEQKLYYSRVAVLLSDLSFTSAYGEYIGLLNKVFDDKYND